ncbi:MAG: S-methyl-5-thioribose-1-phosphate isomerase [Candidatus Woesearchaeota archaeon]
MKVNGKDKRTVWMEDSDVVIINQRLGALPHSYEEVKLKTYKDTCIAIKDMWVSGAGLIGATAGYAMAQAAMQYSKTKDITTFVMNINKAKEEIESTRPTARNLFYATERLYNAIASTKTIDEAVEIAIKEAQAVADEDAENCRMIGVHGSKLIKDGFNIMTHCNAGWLAFVDWGSASSPIYAAHREGKSLLVYVSETRPRLQGSNLTAWEMMNEGVECKVIADNASGALIKAGKVDMVITGADRIAANGDTANKIGTYMKAVCAKENNVPFYIAAPSTTFDLSLEDGDGIPIEERDQSEVLTVTGEFGGLIETVGIAPKGCKALNIAFDVTPHEYITGYITEKGILKAGEIKGNI